MKEQSARVVFLLVLSVTVAGIGDLSAGRPGLICGTPDDPIPCSSFNTAECSYHYNRDSNCCLPETPSFSCPGVCC